MTTRPTKSATAGTSQNDRARQRAATWEPTGVDTLEPEALLALRDERSTAVTAGPGAGKTEFLAQRAAYLLQTGLCPAPQRILAISFKRDAAASLGHRVETRLPDHAGRFVSMTFDAFTKGILDRFQSSLPAAWAMPDGYDLAFPTNREQREFLDRLWPDAPQHLHPALRNLPRDTFVADIVGGWNLPPTPASTNEQPAVYAAMAWWQEHHLRTGRPQLDFVMINKLAELLIRTVPQLRRALRMTYPFVFLDEFQDTTTAQISFLTSVFTGGPVLTAVGDMKQQIMGFAGALRQAFTRYIATFDATPYELNWNFRSSQELVDLQHIIACRLDTTATRRISKVTTDSRHLPVVLWRFADTEQEAQAIASYIATDIAESTRESADFGLVARQKVADLEGQLRPHLQEYGIRLRNDDAMVANMRLQDLLRHDITRLLIGVLRLTVQPTGLGDIWVEVTETLLRIRGKIGDEDAAHHLGRQLTAINRSLRTWLEQNTARDASVPGLTHELVQAIGADDLRTYVRDAGRGEALNMILEAFQARLAAVTATETTWAEAFEEFECADAVTLLTIHRSKGLEYHTVIFLGLDDDQWWAHRYDPDGSTAAFFVGLSRAAHRLIFTTTTTRTSKIADLYEMLTEAGVPEQRWT